MKKSLQIAGDPLSPPALLAKLAGAESVEIRRAVVQNPNIPPEILFSISEELPEALLGNLAFGLLFLENPGLFLSIPERTLLRLLPLLSRRSFAQTGGH